MNREVHVRFWESAGVRFHCATHLSARLRLGRPGQGGDLAVHRFLQHRPPAFFARQEDPRRVLLRDAAGDQTGSMSGDHELPTASVVRSSQATPARRPGQLCTDGRPAGLHLSKPVPCQTTGATSEMRSWCNVGRCRSCALRPGRRDALALHRHADGVAGRRRRRELVDRHRQCGCHAGRHLVYGDHGSHMVGPIRTDRPCTSALRADRC